MEFLQAVDKMLLEAIEKPHTSFMWLGKTYADIQFIVDEFTMRCRLYYNDAVYKRIQHKLILDNGSEIVFKSVAAHADTLRGWRMNGVVIPANAPRDVYDSVKTCLTQTRGWVIEI